MIRPLISLRHMLATILLPLVAGAQDTTTVTTTTTTTTNVGTSTAVPSETAAVVTPPIYPTPSSPDQANLRTGVQLTEVGCMRTLLLLDASAMPYEKLVAQRLTEVDFRVFPGAAPVPSRLSNDTLETSSRSVGITPAELKKAGDARGADLVFFVSVTSREKKRLGEFQLHEAEATVQLFSPATGELFVSKTSRETGVRNLDAVEASRSAIEKAVDLATREAVTLSLEKAHKLLVHQAVITDVIDHNHLLALLDYMARMKGVYHVRQVSYKPETRDAVIEIIGAPQTETFWRAYLEKLPKAQIVDLSVVKNQELRKRYPSWWVESPAK